MSTPVDKTLRLDRTQLGQKRPSGRPPTFLIAIVAGVVAAIVVALVLLPLFKNHTPAGTEQAVGPTPTPTPTTVPVLVAAVAINPRTEIKDSMVKIVQETPDKAPQANSIANPIDAIGKVSIGFIQQGSPVTSDLLSGEGLSLGLAYGIDQGMRAVTISLDPLSSVAGFLKPRDRVDVIGTFTLTNGQTITRTVLQNVLLLATGSQLLPNQSPASVNTGGATPASDNTPAAAPTATVAAPVDIPNATVEVNASDAEKLILAGSKGRLMLALRRFDDVAIEPVPVVNATTITGPVAVAEASPAPISRPIPVPPIPSGIQPAPALPTVTVIKGTTTSSVAVGQ